MKKNQLFKINPDKEIVITILNTFGLKGFQDTNYFTKQTLDELNTAQELTNIIDDINIYYLPCKAKIYTTNIDTKRCITILRHFLKIHNYTLISKEKYINGTKMSVYRLIEIDGNKMINKKTNRKIVISFE